MTPPSPIEQAIEAGYCPLHTGLMNNGACRNPLNCLEMIINLFAKEGIVQPPLEQKIEEKVAEFDEQFSIDFRTRPNPSLRSAIKEFLRAALTSIATAAEKEGRRNGIEDAEIAMKKVVMEILGSEKEAEKICQPITNLRSQLTNLNE